MTGTADRWRKTDRLLLALLLLLAAALRFWKLGGDLWFDEVIDLVYNVRRPFFEIAFLFPGIIPHVFYELLAKVSIVTFGESAAAFRLPAAVFGVAGVWAIAELGRRVGGRLEGLLAALLLATSYHHVFFSQDARGYTMQMFFTTVATTALLAAKESRLRFGSYAAASILNIWTQLFSVFVSAGLTLGYLGEAAAERRRSGCWPKGLARFLWASAAIASISFLLYAPMLRGILATTTGDAQRADYGPRVLGAFGGELLQGLSAAYGPLPIAALALAGLAGLWDLARHRRLATLLLTLPLVLAVAAAAVLNLGMHPRFLIFAAPPGIVILVHGMVRLVKIAAGAVGLAPASAWAAAALAVVVVGFSLVRLGGYYRVPKQNYSGALHFAQREKGRSDELVAVGLAAHAYTVYYAPGIRVARGVQEIEKLRSGGKPVWLMYTLPVELKDRNPRLLGYIQKQFRLVRAFPGTVGGGTLFVCRAGPWEAAP